MVANLDIAFEGPAHPHKANILKYPGERLLDVAPKTESIPESIETAPSEASPR